MKKTLKVVSLLTLLAVISLNACKSELPKENDLTTASFALTNQNGEAVQFPALLKGSVGVVGYIFTNCPDICPITTNNMRLVQERLKSERISGVKFTSISFDPENDSPEVLKSFAEIRNLDLSNWEFLTGEKNTIDSLMQAIGILAVKGDSTVTSAGKVKFYFIHTDRISLLDENGYIRKNYKGSVLDIEEIIADINSLQ